MFKKLHKDIRPIIDRIVHKIKLNKVIEEYERTTYIELFECINIDLKNHNYEYLVSNAPIIKYENVDYNRTKMLRDYVNIYQWRSHSSISVIDVSVNLSNHECIEYISNLMPNICIEIKLIRVDKNHYPIIEFNHRISQAFETGCIDNDDIFDEHCVKCYDLHNEVGHKNKELYCVPIPKRYYFSNGNKKCICKIFKWCFGNMWGTIEMK